MTTDKDDKSTDKTDYYSGIGCAGVILALCIGLSTCMVAESLSSKYKAETDLLKQQLKGK